MAALRWECGSALLSLTASADFGHFGILRINGTDVPSMEIGYPKVHHSYCAAAGEEIMKEKCIYAW